jgi:hypothetical protein
MEQIIGDTRAKKLMSRILLTVAVIAIVGWFFGNAPIPAATKSHRAKAI